MLAAENLGGALLCAQHNFSWLTAGGASGVDTSREQGAGALLVRNDGQRFVLASRIEMERLLAEELSAEEFEPIEFAWEEEKASPTFLVERARALLKDGAALGSDLPTSANARTIEGAVARCRHQLTSSEIERFRRLGSDAGQALGELVKTLAPGESEREIARRVIDALAAGGMKAVVCLVAADERVQRFRHPIPTERRWEKVLMVVVCARRHGLIASLTRIVCAGVAPDELRRRTLATAQVNSRLLAATRAGASGADLYKVAARAYGEVGFEGEQQLHHQGGACGYRTRDWTAHPSSSESVFVNQAFAWNPSITGTKVEETCINFADGVEIITATPGWPQIITQAGGREYTSPDVLAL
ncbi:MAG: chorismate mutase / prephenate dehydratase [Blastocatellia bacterium]|jgi:Xaa-Pro aminopeptidase|nr:chorismate mutase / prephenate dehydratase [Blastocatellia bacterium]